MNVYSVLVTCSAIDDGKIAYNEFGAYKPHREKHQLTTPNNTTNTLEDEATK